MKTLRLALAAFLLGSAFHPAMGAAPSAIAYGADPLQKLDFYPAPGRGAPLVVFIHGGAWMFGDKDKATAAKPDFFTRHGFAFATIDYRLAPQVSVADEARDVAAAIAALRARAAALGFDPDRIALVGHSAGAHLAALVGTDPTYLEQAGVPFGMIRAVSLLDGAGYDVPRQIDMAGPLLRRMYLRAFGRDPVEQRGLSPTLHAALPNAGAFQIFHIASRRDSGAQAEELAAALRQAGTSATTITVEGRTHGQLNQMIGVEGDKTSADMLAFLTARLRP
ncbi:alpha/beta hydrolase [Sphingomonas sp. AP4-R1]|uniref:alpha/beta hydrolase n=1 Tax=Sphingomonas sp. AP4-R1 TaxID=2735134 RepID=UPI001493CAEF|nr:alpha/beta hydrolase [Sphingomonas sp. AP4-R1]QJU59454.1 alpha/beta hydrolase [Sphingomonas sp. AP4-R1]